MLSRRTLRAAKSSTVKRADGRVRTFTGFGATAATTAAICSRVVSPARTDNRRRLSA